MERPNCETPDALWGDDDEQFDLGLEKWGVNVEELKKPLGPRRVFKCWVEDVVPGHGDLDILLVILYRRVKVPSVRSILYSTT